MGTLKKEIAIGFFVGILTTAAGAFLYLEYVSKFGFYQTITLITEGDLYGKVLTLAAIPNLVVFFIYIRKKQDYRARGILMVTILIALSTLFLKFL